MSIDISKIKAGDWVSVTVGYEDQPETHATLSGTVHTEDGGVTLRLGTACLRRHEGGPGVAVRSIDEHKPVRRFGDLKISPDGVPAGYVGKSYPTDLGTWAMLHPLDGHAIYLTDDEVADWADAEAVKK